MYPDTEQEVPGAVLSEEPIHSAQDAEVGVDYTEYQAPAAVETPAAGEVPETQETVAIEAVEGYAHFTPEAAPAQITPKHTARNFILSGMVVGGFLLVLGSFLLCWWVTGDVTLLRLAAVPAFGLAATLLVQLPLALSAGADVDRSSDQVWRWLSVSMVGAAVLLIMVVGLLLSV